MTPVKEDPPPLPAASAFGRFTHRLGELALSAKEHAKEIFAGRMSQWLWITLALVGLIFWLNAELLGPLLKVLAKITLAASVGYAIDRTAFKGSRPHEPLVAAFQLGAELKSGSRNAEPTRTEIRHLRMLSAAYQARRAVIIAACVVGSTLGL